MTALRIPCCPECGSANILADAFTRWNVATQEWEINDCFDAVICQDCSEESNGAEWRDATAEESAPSITTSTPQTTITWMNRPVYAKVMGKAIRIRAVIIGTEEGRIRAANEHCEHIPGWAVLTDQGGMTYLADKSDMGVAPANMEPFHT